MAARNADPHKEHAFAVIERNRQALADLGDAIFYFAEPGLEEHETARLMTRLLAEAGFAVETGISGFPTAFLATAGSGSPVIALHTEYDANPDNSQMSGVAEQRPIVEGAPGHCEGHNVNAAVLVAAAIAVKRTMDEHGIGGTLKVFGAPAEELLLSRPYFVRDGYFDDVDVAIHDHLRDRFSTHYGIMQLAAVSADFTFHGETAHAAVVPWHGRDALDAVVLMDMAVAQYREHMTPAMRAHRVILDGGEQPNVIPSRARVWWYFRDATADGARALFEQAKRMAEGAALMTNTTFEVDVRSAVWPTRCNRTMAEVIQRNIELVGMPEWSAEEEAFARRLQEAAGVKAEGLRREIGALEGPSGQTMGSNDCGDVSWKVPMGRLWFPATVPNVAFHHWSGGAPLATSIAHKGAVAGAKALAGTALDCLRDPAIAQEAQRCFREEIGDTVYEPLLPAGQAPRLDVNRALMERFRPLLEPHYRNVPITFV